MPFLTQLNAVRDSALVERLLIANLRTTVAEIDSDHFEDDMSGLELSLKTLIESNRPFVVRNGGRRWKIVQRWNDPEQLLANAKLEEKLFPNRKYTVYEPEPDGHLNQTHAAPYGFMTLHKYLRTARMKKLYLLGVPDKSGRGASPLECKKNEKSKPVFAEDLDSDDGPRIFENLFQGYLDAKRHVFINSSYSFTNLHYDTDWNTYLCVLGKRAWTIAHPHHSRVLGAANGGASYSVLRPTKGEEGLSDSRLAGLVKFIRVELDPGDVLCLPPTWWHVVEGITDGFSCGINWFYTFPTISTRSPLDEGWKWTLQENAVTVVSNASASMTSGRTVAVLDSHTNQPNAGCERGLNACADKEFMGQILDEVETLFGCTPAEFSSVHPFMDSSRSDFMLARQLMRICLNSVKNDGSPLPLFDGLCREVSHILEKRGAFLSGAGRKRKRFN